MGRRAGGHLEDRRLLVEVFTDMGIVGIGDSRGLGRRQCRVVGIIGKAKSIPLHWLLSTDAAPQPHLRMYAAGASSTPGTSGPKT